MTNARISAFTDTQTTKDLAVKLAVDKSTFTNMKQESLENILRTRVQSSITWATLDTTTLNYTGLEQINLTINPLISGVTATISLTNIPTDSEVFLKITKSSALTIAFSGATVDYFNSTLSTLYFRIISIGSTLFVINLQKKTLGIDNLTAFTPDSDYEPWTYKLATTNTGVSFDYTDVDAEFTTHVLNGYIRGGNMTIHGSVTMTNAVILGSAKKLCNITGYINPGYVVYFSGTNQVLTGTQSAAGYIDADGDIYFANGLSGQTWIFEINIHQ
jgi:hypothetical protein